ncbi:MAG: hypothetical protein HC927_05190 [Deltaproteobacteria bacterium]|nr:hypothetical protein [Deltaproteobacteria bacterium]
MSQQSSINSGFPDLPIDPTREGVDNQDLLGLDSHANALASFIKKCSTPMTIGVQGDWGSGKTSLMNLVRAKLGNERALNIWFNTWQYSQFGNEERLASSMLINLMHKVKVEGKPSKQVWHNASRFVRAVVQAAAASKGVEGKALLDAIEGKSGLDDAGLFEQMKDDFSEVIKDILEQGRSSAGIERVVIYIDDLDRLAPAKAVELLEAVKNLIDVPGCVFVLAIDYDVVIRGLRQRKGYAFDEGREDEGKNFFDKIIQVPYRMPVERYRTQDFLKNHYIRVYGELSKPAATFFEERSAGLIRLSVGNNPRGLKRALNIHSLFSHLISTGDEGEVGEDGRIVTLVLAFVQVAMPGMYSVLAKQANPFRTLVALGEPSVYELIAHDDQSEQFEKVAEQFEHSLRPLLGTAADDDDDDDAPQLVAELRTLVGDLRRVVEIAEVGKQRRMQGLAKIALQAIDLDGNGIYADSELAVLDAALSVAKSTSVEAGEVQVEEETASVQVRRHVGFKELSETMGVFASRPALLFYDPVSDEVDEHITRQPDYETDVSRFNVIVDGASVRLKDETLRIVERRSEQRGGRELTAREASGRIQAADYWVIEGDEEGRTLTMLRDEWKTSAGDEVDTRSPAGRNAYDGRVLAYLRSHSKEFLPARVINEHVGGTIIQLRASLNRLIEQGLATWEGRAKGTRYKALL